MSATECPTIEQVMAATEEENDLPEGGFFPVTFKGRNGSATDEWLFVSEIKPPGLPFSKVASLRLAAKPSDHFMFAPITNKMNRTLMSTDLDLTGLSKLVVRVRCVLRNRRSAKKGFSY